MGELPLFNYFTVQLHLLYVYAWEGSKVSFELAMQDSHPSLYSIKILYHLYISDPF